jgi:hypothetical protein
MQKVTSQSFEKLIGIQTVFEPLGHDKYIRGPFHDSFGQWPQNSVDWLPDSSSIRGIKNGHATGGGGGFHSTLSIERVGTMSSTTQIVHVADDTKVFKESSICIPVERDRPALSCLSGR